MSALIDQLIVSPCLCGHAHIVQTGQSREYFAWRNYMSERAPAADTGSSASELVKAIGKSGCTLTPYRHGDSASPRSGSDRQLADSDPALSTPRLRVLHRTATLRRCSRCCLGRRTPLRARAGAAYWGAVCSCIRCAASAAVRRVVAKKGNRRRIRRAVLTIQSPACQRPATASTLAAPA